MNTMTPAGHPDFEARFLPPSRDRAAHAVTWRTWWDRKFGDALGVTLDQYSREHGIG